jgi:hypothetical protein
MIKGAMRQIYMDALKMNYTFHEVGRPPKNPLDRKIMMKWQNSYHETYILLRHDNHPKVYYSRYNSPWR